MPDEINEAKTGLEQSRGNVIGLFANAGNIELIYNDVIGGVNYINSRFQEIEIGVFLKEWFRVYGGYGERIVPD